jgi:3-hydroxymyristoyl/3-hydroxydecanoyl-(acyl carrier protein) dehydratase
MALEQAFMDDCPYGPGGLLIDDVVEVDVERGYVKCTMPVHEDLPLTREQRAHPVRHPRHVAGGLMVHMTGMVGFVHAYYVLGLRHRDGWIGYGGKIHSARFHNLARMGDKLVLEGITTHLRKGTHRTFARYQFKFTQGKKLVYEGDQAAMWLKVAEGDTATALTL